MRSDLAAVLAIAALAGCAGPAREEVVVYTSQDQVYSEPILAEFTRQTGIGVRAVYDSEAVKTVGLANRLLAERAHPQCDVFWSNEELRTRQLAAARVFRETEGWAAVGFRLRQIVVNTNRIPETLPPPERLADLTNTVWRGRVALAYPLFGTTATHFMALRQLWGDERWNHWCRALRANQPLMVDGNSLVVKLVGGGQAWVGLTDSDDIAAGKREGLPVRELRIRDGEMLIRNTVGVVRQAPHPGPAQRLWEYLQQPAAANRLVAAGALEEPGALRTAEVFVSGEGSSLEPTAETWDRLLAGLEEATAILREIFVR